MDRLLELTARAEANHFWYRGFRRFLTPVIANLAAGRTDLRLLDCGCGTGANLSLLQPYGRVFGFDLWPGAFVYSRGRGFPLARADLTCAPFPSNTFDIATSFDVLQCVEDDERAVAEMARVVRPGGAVLMTVAALEMLRGDHSEGWREFRRYSPATARRLIEGAGLGAERVSFLFGSLFPLMFTVRLGQRLVRPFRELRLDTDIDVPSGPINSVLSGVLAGEAALARRLSLPFGSSLLIVARKPRSGRL